MGNDVCQVSLVLISCFRFESQLLADLFSVCFVFSQQHVTGLSCSLIRDNTTTILYLYVLKILVSRPGSEEHSHGGTQSRATHFLSRFSLTILFLQNYHTTLLSPGPHRRNSSPLPRPLESCPGPRPSRDSRSFSTEKVARLGVQLAEENRPRPRRNCPPQGGVQRETKLKFNYALETSLAICKTNVRTKIHSTFVII